MMISAMNDMMMMMIMMIIAVKEDGERQGQDLGQVWVEKVEKPYGALQTLPLL